ncbi:hypothetical protein ACKWTF_004292 [Chironomus riparius]
MFPGILKSFQSNRIILEEIKNAAVITLNRPKKMNTITPGMHKELYELIKGLEASDNKLVIIQGAGNQAFCAGIDLLRLKKSIDMKQNWVDVGTSIQFNVSNATNLLSMYKKPYLALYDGITMGAGCSFSMPSKYRIATERTIFAMPETEIGFLTNAGASFFLPRLNYNLGYYIGLSGAKIHGYDVKKYGLATHYIESKKLDEFVNSVVECQDDYEVEKVILQFSSNSVSKDSVIEKILPNINKCFNGGSVEEIIDNLSTNGSEWAIKTVKKLNRMSPTSLKICHKLLKMGNTLSLQECLKIENTLIWRMSTTYPEDFMEGIRAMIIDKDMKPKWNPRALKDVSDEHIDKFFELLPKELELKLENVVN